MCSWGASIATVVVLLPVPHLSLHPCCRLNNMMRDATDLRLLKVIDSYELLFDANYLGPPRRFT